MNSRRETAAVHRPGRDPQRVLPTTPPSYPSESLGAQIDSVKAAHETEFPPASSVNARGQSRIRKPVTRRTRVDSGPERCGRNAWPGRSSGARHGGF